MLFAKRVEAAVVVAVPVAVEVGVEGKRELLPLEGTMIAVDDGNVDGNGDFDRMRIQESVHQHHLH